MTRNHPIEIESGVTQSHARKVNNSLVIREIRNSAYSATQLSNALGLSNAALSSILKGLENDSIIKKVAFSSPTNKGRKQVMYSLNDTYGLIIVISLSNNRYKIVISNIAEAILFEKEEEVDHYDLATINNIILMTQDILLNNYKNIPIKQLMVSLSARVNSLTYELQPSKHFDEILYDKNNNLLNIFKKHFSCPVMMQNDTNFAITGESRFGCLEEDKNSFLAYIDNGIGGAFNINGELYTGEYGYAGEFGLMTATFEGQTNYLDEFVSLRALKDYASQKFHKKYHVKELVNDYFSNQELHDYINKTAQLIGEKLRDIAEVFNLSHIIIGGRVTLFKDEYISIIQNEINKALNKCRLSIQKNMDKFMIAGALSTAVDLIIDRL